MQKLICLTAVLAISFLAGCATTEYKTFEAKNNLFEGKGGTKVIVDGMEVWDNGDPPRQFTVIGMIDDQRPGGFISMSQLRTDVVKKAREAGGDAVIQLGNQSHLAGFYTSGSASGYSYGNTANVSGTSTTLPMRRNVAKFAVIKFVD